MMVLTQPQLLGAVRSARDLYRGLVIGGESALTGSEGTANRVYH